MDRSVSQRLSEALGDHLSDFLVDRKEYSQVLSSIDLANASKFPLVLPDEARSLEAEMDGDSEKHKYYKFSLRRILRNGEGGNFRLPIKKDILATISFALGFYSSDALLINLGDHRSITNAMKGSLEPFSLLGKLRTFDHNNPDNTLYTTSRPILIIPGESKNLDVLEWEQANTIYEKGVGLLLLDKRISLQEYLSRS